MNLTSPKNWKTVKLGDVITLQRGFDLPVQDRTKGIYPLVVSDGIGDYIHEYKVEGPGVVTGRSGTLGKVAWIEDSFWPLNTTLWVKDFHGNDRKFIYYFLKKFPFEKFNAGSGVPTLNRNHIDNVIVSIPESLDEQRSIAAILGSLDDKIELLRRENKTLESIAQALFWEWFVEFRFPGYEGVKVVDGVPEGWKVGTVMDVIDRLSISYKCDKDDLDPQGKTPIIDQGATGLYGYTKRDPDMQASTENPVIVFTNHTCNLWFINYPFCAIQNVIPFRGKNGYNEYFIYFMTKGQVSFIEYKGHWPDFEIKEYVIPPVEIAKQFSEAVKPIVHKMWGNNSEIQTLSRLRDQLLDKIFSN